MVGPTLIIGTQGLVGSNRFGFDQGRKLLTPKEEELDITKKEAVFNYFDENTPRSVILLAAYTDVDGAEQNRDLAWRVNVEGVENIAAAAKKSECFLIYISTDFVFPGTPDLPGPYSEYTAPPGESESRGWYGETKYQGEKVVQKLESSETAIVRIAFPFGNVSNPRDYLRKIIRGAKEDHPLFADQQITPTYTGDLWQALDKIEVQKRSGIWHVAAKPLTTPYQLAVYLNEQLNLGLEVRQGSLVEYMQKNKGAPRPLLGGLKTGKTENELEISFKTWKEAVDEITPEFNQVAATP